MGKFFVSAFVALGLLVFGANLVSAEETESTQSTSSTVTAPNEVMVEGQVTAIEGDTLQIKDKSGYDHSFKVTDPTMLNEFKSGDSVEILIQSSEEGMEGTTGTEPEPMATTPAPTPAP
ncbi:MAG TPA: hypothetical protein VLB01_00390 [Thermodesulfobacteriota bacterium]|nr:hypothetical protein [Thermodesulfobacteriota bacterium]